MKFLFVFIFLTSCGSALTSKLKESSCFDGDIETRLKSCMSGVNVEKKLGNVEAWTTYEVKIDQPIDHENPELGSFKQRVHVYHAGDNRPTVVYTSGYKIFGPRLSEPTRILGANQIYIEHRFFDPSSPDNKDWSYLNIKQSADDFHKIVQEFKKIYKGKWLNTGGSKGGMTSVYHRRFYPDDLDMTIAYVAPLSFSNADPRYDIFLETVGGRSNALCRNKLDAMRREVLLRKDQLSHYMNGNYQRLGGNIPALELAASESFFVFWQYSKASDCSSIPSVNESDGSLFRKFDAIVDVSAYGDVDLSTFEAYYYQAATELGAPGADINEIEDLIDYPHAFNLETITPENAAIEYNPAVMVDIDEWVQNEGERIIFINGENDPWNAAPFRHEGFVFDVPNGNHGSNISQLSPNDRNIVYDYMEEWLGESINRSLRVKPTFPPRMIGRRP